jgi:hypothetical protein
VSATLARKSVTTMFHSKEDITIETKERLANHMKHKLETASKHYNLVKNMKSAEGLTNKIENDIFIIIKFHLQKNTFSRTREINLQLTLMLKLMMMMQILMISATTKI